MKRLFGQVGLARARRRHLLAAALVVLVLAGVGLPAAFAKSPTPRLYLPLVFASAFSPSVTSTPAQSPTPGKTGSVTPTATPTSTPAQSPTPGKTGSVTPTATPAKTVSPTASLTATPSPTPPSGTYDWLQFGGNPQHTSDNTLETTITTTNVGSLQLLFRTKVPNGPDSAVVYLNGVSTPSGVRDLIFSSTLDGHILALDAHTGVLAWSQMYGPGTCLWTKNLTPCFSTVGPALDPNRQYVYTRGPDGFVHKLQVGDGVEIVTGGWPERVTLKPSLDKGSSPLTFATARNGVTYLYAATASEGDQGDYQGHVTAINLADGSQHVFNNVCSDQTVYFAQAPATPNCSQTGAGIWGRSGVMYDAATDRIYEASGNALWDPPTHMWGDTVLALHPDGTGVNGGPLDSYTPTNQAILNQKDLDLGASDPILLPVPSTSPYQHVALQFEKDFTGRLLNLDNLSGQGGPGFLGGEIANVTVPQDPVPLFKTGVRSDPALWVNSADQSTWFFLTDENALTAFRITWTTTPTIQPMWRHNNSVCQCKFPDGNSPLVANGVLYVEYPSGVQALNPVDGTILFNGPTIGVHWNSPVVVNGVLYVTNRSGDIQAFTVPGASTTQVAAQFHDYSQGFPPPTDNPQAAAPSWQ